MAQEVYTYLVTLTAGHQRGECQKQANVVGVYDRASEALLLTGLLIGEEKIRSIMITRIARNGESLTSFMWGSPWISEDWCETVDHEWEINEAHQLAVRQWIPFGPQGQFWGTKWELIPHSPDLPRLAESAGLFVATLVSNADIAGAGQSGAGPGELPL